MTTIVDTNVLIALWDSDAQLNAAAQKALDSWHALGALVITGDVYAELLALPTRTEVMLDQFLDVSWYPRRLAIQRRDLARGRQSVPGLCIAAEREGRRNCRDVFLADFLIGAHASVRGSRLLTLDQRLYRAAFPDLEIATF